MKKRTTTRKPDIYVLFFSLLGLLLACSCTTPQASQAPEQTDAVEDPGTVPEENLAEVTQTIPPEEPDEPAQPETMVIHADPVYLESIGISFLTPVIGPEKPASKQEPEFVEATGYGFPAPGATNALQKMLTATEAAQYRAMANLAEKHSGLDVHRKAKTVDMAFAEETVNINLSASLSGISEVDRNYDEQEKMATITLRMMIPPPSPEVSPEEIALMNRRNAEDTARIHAAAQLREEAGKLDLKSDVLITDLLKDTRYTEAQWTTNNVCEVKASLKVDSSNLNPVHPDTEEPSEKDS